MMHNMNQKVPCQLTLDSISNSQVGAFDVEGTEISEVQLLDHVVVSVASTVLLAGSVSGSGLN